ncbi:MAG TPA: PadR family transcriptional regulator [Bryobacteraceae bacterium]|nr:PadR family transcriptional regulator [Bryobacteraceae bacterium]
MKPLTSQFLPLSPAALHILMTLAGEDRHGYGIMREVARQSDGQYRLGPGTLYDNLQRLLDKGLVAESTNPTDQDDPRRRYYRLTNLGRQVLAADISRLEEMFRTAKLGLAGTKPRRA